LESEKVTKKEQTEKEQTEKEQTENEQTVLNALEGHKRAKT
jgi:hypothetical protein